MSGFAVTAGLFDALALAIALFEQPQVVLHVFVAGILALCSRERRVRAFVVTTQHVREALIAENLDGRSNDVRGRRDQTGAGDRRRRQGRSRPRHRADASRPRHGNAFRQDRSCSCGSISCRESQLIVSVAAEKTLHRFSRHTDLLDDCAGRVGCLCGVPAPQRSPAPRRRRRPATSM